MLTSKVTPNIRDGFNASPSPIDFTLEPFRRRPVPGRGLLSLLPRVIVSTPEVIPLPPGFHVYPIAYFTTLQAITVNQ